MKKFLGFVGITTTVVLLAWQPHSYATILEESTDSNTDSSRSLSLLAQGSDDFADWAETCVNTTGKEALDACQRAIEVNPDEPLLWLSLGAEEGKSGQHQQSLDSLNKALELEPNYSLAYYNKCVVLSSLGRHQEAAIACATAIDTDANWGEATKAQAYNNLGVALVELNLYEQALIAYGRALELDSDYNLARQNYNSLKNYLDK
ncbi:MAG: tetratricopeptide repeat protein [Spirulinaceae cyanobacterium]